MAISSGKWPYRGYDIWRDHDDWKRHPAVKKSSPTAEEIEEFRRAMDTWAKEREPNYPPYFMAPGLELAYATLTPDEKKEVMRIAREECGTFYHVEHALQVTPIFQKHIQAVLEKSKNASQS